MTAQAGLKRGAADAGSVNLIQRFGSAANLSIHLHRLVRDEVYRHTADEPVPGGMRSNYDWPLMACAVLRRRFPVGERPIRQPLQPEATGAGMEETRCLKPSGKACHEIR